MNSFLAPFKESVLFKIIVALFIFLYSLLINAQVDKSDTIYKILEAKDRLLFERTFNNCEIEKLDSIIAENFEFYHDVAGIQNKETFVDAVKNNICKNPGNMKRNLVAGSLEVFALKNNGLLYGAIQTGKHRFRERQQGILTTVGIANFTHVWILENKQWKLKRVLSYNHLPFTE